MFYLGPLLVSFIASLIFTPVIKKLARHYQIVDYPQPRKIHRQPVPLLGGLAIFISFALSVGIFWSLGWIIDSRITTQAILGLLLAGLVLTVGGWLDDKYNLAPWRQIIFPLIAIAIAVTAGITIQHVTNPFGGIITFSPLVGTILAAGWLLGMIYTTKLLDGLDGLAAGITAIGALIIFVVSLFWDLPLSGTSVLALILAGVMLGFLIFNWHPAKIFLGEGGSIFCGFALGALAIISGSKIATALLIMGIPILDVAWVILRRLWQKKSPVEADRKHLHFRLLDIGLTHRQAVIVLYVFTATFGSASLFLHSKGKIIALGVVIIIMIILASLLVIIYERKTKKTA